MRAHVRTIVFGAHARAATAEGGGSAVAQDVLQRLRGGGSAVAERARALNAFSRATAYEYAIHHSRFARAFCACNGARIPRV